MPQQAEIITIFAVKMDLSSPVVKLQKQKHGHLGENIRKKAQISISITIIGIFLFFVLFYWLLK